jgi:hypothetical protein
LLSGPLACGKGGGGKAAVPVSGRITMDNSPLANASITFQPADGGNVKREYYGTTDEQGNYTLTPSDAEGAPGAPPGKYYVKINLFDRGGPDRPPRQKVPARYNKDSKETFNVPPEGTKDANFDLKSK